MSAPEPYRAAAHQDDEPERADVGSGAPCPACGLLVYRERARTGEPMRWVHRDDTPACPPRNLSPHIGVQHYYGNGDWPGWSS